MYVEAVKAAVRVTDSNYTKDVGNLLAVIAFEQDNLPGEARLHLVCGSTGSRDKLHVPRKMGPQQNFSHHENQHRASMFPLFPDTAVCPCTQAAAAS
jgi:hypothetical protein